MRHIIHAGLVVVFTVTAATAGTGSQDGPADRVRATEPTVLNIREVGDKGSQAEPHRRHTGGKIRRGSAGTSRIAVRTAGWLLNTGDDIPSSRERAAMQAQAGR